MASSERYLEYILDCLSSLDGITHRSMMKEYVIYYRGKIIGGIYDDRFLIKPTPSAELLLPDAPRALPYEGAKEMLTVENPEDKELLNKLVNAVFDELPAQKNR